MFLMLMFFFSFRFHLCGAGFKHIVSILKLTHKHNVLKYITHLLLTWNPTNVICIKYTRFHQLNNFLLLVKMEINYLRCANIVMLSQNMTIHITLWIYSNYYYFLQGQRLKKHWQLSQTKQHSSETIRAHVQCLFGMD